MNTTQQLYEAGQAVWYDNIQRRLLQNGELAGMIERGEIRGVTSNPSIFMNAITHSDDYDAALAPLAREGLSTQEIYDRLSIADIQAAADLFLPYYRKSWCCDGFVSLEVSPYLAHDTAGTLAEAQRLWRAVNRPNLMIKIPATREGLPAITAALADGLNVNVTLIFSRQRYAEVMEAYLKGLEQRAAAGLKIDSVASVASFFVSRLDTKVDGWLQKLVDAGGPKAEGARSLMGKTAIANARLAYADFKEVFAGKRFAALQVRDATVQRPLWASTSTKNPAYRDVVYIEELVGCDTVNTIPPQTLLAFLDHGKVRRDSLEEDLDAARMVAPALAGLGLSLDDATRQLEEEGVTSFADAFTALLKSVEERRKAALGV